MTQPSSSHNHKGKRNVCRRSPTGWELVLPTTKLAATSLQSPENLVKIGPSVQKLFMIFQNTDAQTDRQTNHPCTIYRYVRAKNIYALFFLPLVKQSEHAKQAYSV